MDEKLLRRIDDLIEKDRDELVKDIICLVNIKSIRGIPEMKAPFGNGPKRVLDAALKMGTERGFISCDYEMGIGSVAMNKGKIDLGIWTHGDVVPEGDDWLFEPYDAMEYKGCVIGRGSADNKGQLVSILHILDIFKKENIKLKYNPALFIGSCEETGMNDVKAFVKQNSTPSISLVPDGAFPVGYGGKGCAVFKLKADQPLENVVIEAGHKDSPGKAVAILCAATECPELEKCTVERGDYIRIITQTPPRHSSSPDPNGNMISVITSALIDNQLVSEHDALKLDFLRKISVDTHGKMMGIYTDPISMGELILTSTDITNINGKPEISIKVRYPIETTFDAILENIDKTAQMFGFKVSYAENMYNPYLMNKDQDIVQTLTAIANDVIGTQANPYTLSGGTYAHILPNAYVFGTSANHPPEGYPAGRGGAHGVDECVSIARLQRAMRIYARAMLTLNEKNW